MRSYLNARSLKYGVGQERAISYGVPQGSVLGPILWNLMYDEILEGDLGSNSPGSSSATHVAFADDVTVVAMGRTIEILEETANSALAPVAE